MSYLLINSLDQASRDYMANNDTSGYTIVDWYRDQDAVDSYLAAGGPHPSSFPEVVTLPPQPDLVGFKNALLADTNIPIAAKLSLFTFTAVLNDLVAAIQAGEDPSGVLTGTWQEIKASDSSLSGYCADGTTLITTQIETYSTMFNIGLV